MSELTIDLVRHMKAKNKQKWTHPDDRRPLSKLGRRQADRHAAAMAHGDPIRAVYSSPALRCRETIEPLAQYLGIEVRIEPLLAETNGYEWPPGWEGFNFGPNTPASGNPIGAAHAAGRGLALLQKLRAAHPNGGRIVACSHGDTIPVTVAALAASAGVELPRPLWGFGGWYRLRFAGDAVRIERFDPPAGFPQ